MYWNFIDNYSGDRYANIGEKVYDLNQLTLDQYYFTITTTPESDLKNVYLYTRHKECFECPYKFIDKSVTNTTKTNQILRLASDYRNYYPQNFQDNVICDLEDEFGQFGVYNIKVDNLTTCHVDVVKEPVNAYLPILTVVLLHIAVFGVLYFILKFWHEYTRDGNNVRAKKKDRVMSLDAFRGISIVIMIFVNFGGGGYDFLEHVTWNGLHVADLVFPWFVWIMGACVPISLLSSFKKNVPNKTLMWNVFKRSVKLFLLGIFLNSGNNLYSLRIFGVLQRFGVCYFAISTICIFTMDRNFTPDTKTGIWTQFEDVLKVWKSWLICLVILALHTALIFSVAAPGCPSGYLGPGGLHKNRTYENCIGGATGYIDKLLLGSHNIYQYPTIYEVYEARPFDPEGVVGCLTTIFQVMLGVQAGVTLLVYKQHLQRITRWLTWSVILGAIGGGLCGFSQENGIIPVNKNLWSLSFVMVTSSFAFFLLSACYYLIDVKKWWSGKPVLFAGMNAILLYVGHEMTGNNFPVRWYYSEDSAGEWRRTHFMALLSDTWASDFWTLVSYYLYKIDYFFTV